MYVWLSKQWFVMCAKEVTSPRHRYKCVRELCELGAGMYVWLSKQWFVPCAEGVNDRSLKASEI